VGSLDYRLTLLEGAKCEVTSTGHVFSGHGTATKDTEKGWALSFTITEASGKFSYQATLTKKGKSTVTESAPLKTKTEKIS
jgi:hypothetical protein